MISSSLDTAWTFLRREEPHTLDMMTDPIDGMLPQLIEADAEAELMGIEGVPVPYAVIGGWQVKAYPAVVWERVFR